MSGIGGALAALSVLVLCSTACESKKEKADLDKDEVAALLADYDKARKAEAKRQAAEAPSGRSTKEAPGAAPRAATSTPRAEGSGPVGAAASKPTPAPSTNTLVPPPDKPVAIEGPWIADESTPIAPAGPITATPKGVVLYSRARQIHVARLGPLSKSNKPAETPITDVPKSAGTFPLGRGPAVFQDHAYWIDGGKLFRRELPGRGGASGPLEELAGDARDGTRVAAPMDVPGQEPKPIPATVAYVVRPESKDPEAPLLSKLWVEGARPLLLTPEGSSTHAIRLVRQPEGVLAISMHARMAMTPVHARRIAFDDKGKPKLDEDLVVWVGGGVQPLTELTLLPGPDAKLHAFIPHEKSITDFGIADLDIGQNPDMDTPTRWLFYPNGIDPAPLDVGYICGEPAVLYAQPRSADPDAHQQLVLRSLADVTRAQELARAEAFYSVSLSEVPGGGLASWVADWVSWARTVRCRGS